MKNDNGLNHKDEDTQSVSLKEFFSQKIDGLEDSINLKFKAIDDALKIQAREYERRLSDLNHEAQQLKSMQSTYVPRETFENYSNTVEENIRNLELSKAELKGKASQSSLNYTMAASIIGLLISLSSLILRLR